MKGKTANALAVTLRGLKELHGVSPGLFPVIVLSAAVSAIIPYVTVFFSAQILKELTLLRRPELLWRWVAGGVFATGTLAVCKALLSQRFETLYDDVWGRKEILFCRKMFSLDFADMDKQQTHDLRAQIQQAENWSGYGLSKVPEYFEQSVRCVIGMISGVSLTVSLFTSPVPEDAGWLTVLNHPAFALLFAAIIIIISLLAGKIYGKVAQLWSSAAETA